MNVFNDNIFSYSIQNGKVIIGNTNKHNNCQNGIYSLQNFPENVNLPSSVEHQGETHTVREIYNNAFCYNLIKSVKIPKTFEAIGVAAFAFCEKLEEVEFEQGSNLIKVSSRAFEQCVSLSKIIIPSSVSIIQYGVFSNTSLQLVYYCGKSSFSRSAIFSNVNESMKIYTVLGVYPSRYFGQRKTIASTECLIDHNIKGKYPTCIYKTNNSKPSLTLI